MLRVTLYSRPGCKLCEEARRQMIVAAPEVIIEEVDVDSDSRLRERYGWDIPVAVQGDRELFRHRFDPACLELIRIAR